MSVFSNIVSHPAEPQRDPEVSIIAWVNDPKKYNDILLSTLHPVWGVQRGHIPIEFIAIGPEEGCRSLGEAYELGRERSRAEIRCYLHQDMAVLDPSFLLKLVSIARACPKIGALGFVGSRHDTGASWMHAPAEDSVGIAITALRAFTDVTFERVSLVDGYGFITMPSAAFVPWPAWYEGVHMVVEDMAMALRNLGLEIWTIDSASSHESPGKVDDSYWRAASIFYELWHRDMDDHAMTPLELRELEERRAARFS